MHNEEKFRGIFTISTVIMITRDNGKGNNKDYYK